MATLVLSAAGSALGGGLGGSLFGLTTAALGKAAGATLGSMLDQRLLGAGAAAVETGRIDRLRVMGSSEGAALPRCFGRMRLPGQLIWSSRFRETASRERVGGKATAPSQTVTQYGYSISLAVALCEGEVMRLGRIWADGQPLDQSGIVWRLHPGGEDQLPDPVIEAIEGVGRAPAYRGTAYIVFEDLDLGQFGNRIPQFNVEVFRQVHVPRPDRPRPAALDIRGVALVPGTGEYSLATEPVTMSYGRGETVAINVNNDRGIPDLVASLEQMEAELPSCAAVSLVVSWFADDLRIDRAALYPAVEQGRHDGDEMPWRVCGSSREDARIVSEMDGRPLFGGTPADAAVVQSILHMRRSGKAVMFYPFILLDILENSGRENPWDPGSDQPPVPWRGRMTLSRAPGVPGSPDGTAAAAGEVEAFFGAAKPDDYTATGGSIAYHGPSEWSYRRFVLHYAHLCKLAGGVDAFCIGSEMRALTQIRDGTASYPAVRALCRLAEDVRAILGPGTKISYAADWSEYFGHQPNDGSGDAIFHLDPLWSHPAIDFIGIDNYMPLSDWRDGPEHADAGARSVYDLDYLKDNVAGGEGYDWYYPSTEARSAQLRVSIEDGAYGEPWIYRYKDIRNWWSNQHFDRIAGVRSGAPTSWVPASKPIWFTEVGCPAIDRGTNQPNVFFDPKSSESFFPYFSEGTPDDFVQKRYLQAVLGFWASDENNPVSPRYGDRMVALERAFVWAWDARPWPDFPHRLDTWIDGLNYERGHWLNGRIASPDLSDVVLELCQRANLQAVDVSRVYGSVTGYMVLGPESARQSLQPLLLAFGLDAHPRAERLVFAERSVGAVHLINCDDLVVGPEGSARLKRVRSSSMELPQRASLSFVRADEDYRPGSVDWTAHDALEPATAEISAPIVLTAAKASMIAERWIHEASIAREAAEFTLPPSYLAVVPGEVVEVRETFETRGRLYRVDRTDEAGSRSIQAVSVDDAIFEQHRPAASPPQAPAVMVPTSAHAEFLDVPLIPTGDLAHAPHVAIVKKPWTGPVAVYSSADGSDFTLGCVVDRPATLGVLVDHLPMGAAGLWMRHPLRVHLESGELKSRSAAEVLAGANTAALKHRDGSDIEIIQFVDARLIEPRTYELSHLLRGQLGSDAFIPEQWPVGTDFVLLDSAVVPIDVPGSALGQARDVRFGPAGRSLYDASFRQTKVRIAGAGLRPLRPVHLTSRFKLDGSIELSWIRRSRVLSDGWHEESPVGEESLTFELRVFDDDRLCRRTRLSAQTFTYSVKDREVDRVTGNLLFSVSQVSSQFGPGPAARMLING